MEDRAEGITCFLFSIVQQSKLMLCWLACSCLIVTQHQVSFVCVFFFAEQFFPSINFNSFIPLFAIKINRLLGNMNQEEALRLEWYPKQDNVPPYYHY